MVRFGLHSFSYHLHLEDMDNPRDPYWFLRKVVALGLDGACFDARHLQGWNEELVRGIGEVCADNGLYLELGSGGFDFERLSKRLALAAEVGARTVRTFIAGEKYKLPEDERPALLQTATESFRRLDEAAQRSGVVLTIENHEDLTGKELLAILDAVDSPFVRACVDTANSLTVWEDPVDCVCSLAPLAAETHLKDWKHWWEEGIPQRQGCALGQGDARIADVYPILRKANPLLPITLEIPTIGPHAAVRTLREEEDNVQASIAYVTALEAKLK